MNIRTRLHVYAYGQDFHFDFFFDGEWKRSKGFMMGFGDELGDDASGESNQLLLLD